MKKITFLLVLFFFATKIQAQAPQGIPYQAVARDNAGNLIKNQNIALRFSIHDGTANGTVVFTETHAVTTDALGLFAVNIGGGTSSGTLADVNWGSGAKFTQVELDVTGGSNYTDMGTTQMMSVPYALYAANANVPGVPGPRGPTGATGATGRLGPQGATGSVGSVTAISGTSNANGATISGGNLTLTPADGTNGGVVTTGTQTFAGNKTFTGTTTANSFVKTGGTSTQYLMADGSTSAGTVATTMGAIGASSAANGAIITSGVLSLAPANATYGGIVTTGTQTFAGSKTFTGTLNVQTNANSTAAVLDGSNADDNTAVLSVRRQDVTSRSISFYPSMYDGVADVAYQQILFSYNVITPTHTTRFVGGSKYTFDGNVGIGNTAPSAKLDVTGTIKIADGTQGAGKVLTSDASGLASWQSVSVSPCSYAIGQNVTALGGIIFYLDASGCHGLVCAPTDQSKGIGWYNGSNTNTTAFADCVGGGGGNTAMIIYNQGATATSYAAGLARAYTGGGFSDWYLPSKYELNLMQKNIGQGNVLGLGNVGLFNIGNYWSSTEISSTTAWSQYFGNGGQNRPLKDDTYYVRAVRAF